METSSQSCGSIYLCVLGSFSDKFSPYTQKDNHCQYKSVLGLVIQQKKGLLFQCPRQGRILLAVLGHKSELSVGRSVMSDSLRPQCLSMEFSRQEYWSGLPQSCTSHQASVLSSGIVQHGLSAHTADILDSSVERGGSFCCLKSYRQPSIVYL